MILAKLYKAIYSKIIPQKSYVRTYVVLIFLYPTTKPGKRSIDI